MRVMRRSVERFFTIIIPDRKTMQSSDEALLGQSLTELLDTLPPKISSRLFKWAASASHSIAVRDHKGNTSTYAELADQVRESQKILQNLGVSAGDRVLLINENCVVLTVLILALSELDALSVVVNARMSASELQKIKQHCQPRTTFYLLDSQAVESHWLTARARASDQQTAHGQSAESQSAKGDSMRVQQLTLGSASIGVELDKNVFAADQALVQSGVCSLIYTTGTTGDPKGVMLTHRNILYVAAITSVLRGMRADDRIYAVLPISHVFGLAAVFLATIYVGAELVLVDHFDARQTIETLRSAGITGMFGVPTMFARLLEYAKASGLKPQDMPRLRFIYSGGAPLDSRIKADTETLFGLTLLNAYGMTETGPTICQVRFNELLDSCSVGRPLPGLSVKVLNDKGQPAAEGETGELHIKGPNVMLGYYRNPQATAAVLDVEGYLNTGDLVRFDASGNMHIAGRSKELIIHSGFNVYPPEVEAVIARHPEVTICAVVGRTINGNEEVVAFVQRAVGSTLDARALSAFIKPDLAAYKRPSEIIFMDALPAAPSGKVLKHQLLRL
jgi:long-chain acyl-CoA synthetase